MIRLYESIDYPHCWIAYMPGTGWLRFPAQEGGWEKRQPAHGLDPIHLREVPLRLAAKTRLPVAKPKPARRFAKVA